MATKPRAVVGGAGGAGVSSCKRRGALVSLATEGVSEPEEVSSFGAGAGCTEPRAAVRGAGVGGCVTLSEPEEFSSFLVGTCASSSAQAWASSSPALNVFRRMYLQRFRSLLGAPEAPRSLSSMTNEDGAAASLVWASVMVWCSVPCTLLFQLCRAVSASCSSSNALSCAFVSTRNSASS